MIVVCGDLGRPSRGASAILIAGRAAQAGSAVQLVGVVPDDPEGGRRLLDLAAAGVGHAAVLRSPARDLDPADVDLALRYLPDARVVVTIGLGPAVVEVAGERAAWAGATLIVIGNTGAGDAAGPDLPDDAIALDPPPTDPDGTFAGFVGVLAARLDAGATPADAWAATTRALAVDAVSP
jgi:hypothetical protein